MLAAPCCHHDIAAQLQRADTPAPYAMLTRSGILRERFADTLTDAMRSAVLRMLGYRVDVIDFVDSKHTPRNTLLRAVRTGGRRTAQLRQRVRRPDQHLGRPAQARGAAAVTGCRASAGWPRSRPSRCWARPRRPPLAADRAGAAARCSSRSRATTSSSRAGWSTVATSSTRTTTPATHAVVYGVDAAHRSHGQPDDVRRRGHRRRGHRAREPTAPSGPATPATTGPTATTSTSTTWTPWRTATTRPPATR